MLRIRLDIDERALLDLEVLNTGRVVDGRAVYEVHQICTTHEGRMYSGPLLGTVDHDPEQGTAVLAALVLVDVVGKGNKT